MKRKQNMFHVPAQRGETSSSWHGADNAIRFNGVTICYCLSIFLPPADKGEMKLKLTKTSTNFRTRHGSTHLNCIRKAAVTDVYFCSFVTARARAVRTGDPRYHSGSESCR